MFNCNQGFVEISRFVTDEMRDMLEADKVKRNYAVSMASIEDDSPILLFGTEFFYLDEESLHQLVRSARDILGKLTVDDVRRDLGDSECARRRADINLLFRVILGQLSEFEEKVLLDAISTLQNGLPDLVDVIEDSGTVKVKELSLVSYEYLHALLDWRWLGLVLHYEMHKAGIALKEYEELYFRVLVSLVRIALLKYNNLAKAGLVTDHEFYCPCVKKLWISMITLSENENKKLDFWNYLQKAWDAVKCKKEDLSRKQNKMHGLSAKANDFLFQTWMMNGISSLYQYHILDAVSMKETAIIRISKDYSILDRAIKEVLQGDKLEEQLRAFLLLLKPVYSRWWPIKHDFLVTLWDYFNKRLNSPFQLPTENLSKLACISRSPTGFLEQARYQASPEAFETLDSNISSFKCYITLMAFMLRYYSDNNQKTKVQILFNRTILKIAPIKLESMTEQGIYNFTLMMLTMMEATPYQDDYPRLSKQLLQFKLDHLNSSAMLDSTIRRITTIVLANMTLILAFNQRHYDKTAHMQQFLENLDEACLKFGDRLQPSLHVLAEGMSGIYEKAISKGGIFEKGEEKFVGAWIANYLKGCSESERDALLNIFVRLFECLKANALSRGDCNNEIFQPFYENVLPYIKDAFNQPTNSCLLIADLAAYFTLFSKGQSYATPFLAMFSFFINNTCGHTNLRMHYINLIVKSDRVCEIEERLLIRCWLKSALLNGRDHLRELSYVVSRSKEFRAVCDIPEYDLCDGDEDPILLFFKFVGKKYRSYDGMENRAQYEMSIKLHAMFQHFDKWIENPNVVTLKRILTVLAVAVKECGAAIYIKNNLTCLYSVAYKQYFLPMSVLLNRNVPNEVILAMGKLWPRIMDAIGQMNFAGDLVISDHATNMIVKWIPQFFKYKDKNDIVKPFLTFFTSHNEPFIKFLFSRYLLAYVDLQGSIPKQNSDIGLKMLLFLLEALQNSQDYGKIAFFIQLNAYSIMDHAMLCQDNFESKTIASELVFKMLDCTQSNSNLIKIELKKCLSSFTKKNLPMESSVYFKFMYKLADKNPGFIKSMISTIHLELTETERLRGGGEDKHLRRLLSQLEGAVEASFFKLTM